MTALFADCPTHGIVLINNVVNVRPGGDVKMRGSAECPECGLRSAFINGHYRTSQTGNSSVTLSPSLAQTRRLQTALLWAQGALGDGSVAEATVERKIRRTLEKEAPGLVSMVDAALGPKSATLAAWIAIMLTIMTAIIGGQQDHISQEDLKRIIEQVQAEPREEQLPHVAPSPTTDGGQ
jgi:hypothetical protein